METPQQLLLPAARPASAGSTYQHQEPAQTHHQTPNALEEPEYVCRYTVTKHSWRGKYKRIFCISPTQILTLDPVTLATTNEYDIATDFEGAALVAGGRQDPLQQHALEFTINVRNEGRGKFKPMRFSSRSYYPCLAHFSPSTALNPKLLCSCKIVANIVSTFADVQPHYITGTEQQYWRSCISWGPSEYLDHLLSLRKRLSFPFFIWGGVHQTGVLLYGSFSFVSEAFSCSCYSLWRFIDWPLMLVELWFFFIRFGSFQLLLLLFVELYNFLVWHHALRNGLLSTVGTMLVDPLWPLMLVELWLFFLHFGSFQLLLLLFVELYNFVVWHHALYNESNVGWSSLASYAGWVLDVLGHENHCDWHWSADVEWQSSLVSRFSWHGHSSHHTAVRCLRQAWPGRWRVCVMPIVWSQV